MFPDEQLLSRLTAALTSRKNDIQGLALQCEDSTDFETRTRLLATLMHQMAPMGLPCSLRLLGSPSLALLSSLVNEHSIDYLDARFLSHLSNQGKALLLTDAHSILSTDLHSIVYKRDAGALQSGCLCFSCQNHRRAYIHHLLNTKEMLAQILISAHNLHTAIDYFCKASHEAQGSL